MKKKYIVDDTSQSGLTVSVVMTCYNEGEFVEAALRSVLAQTATEQIREIIIIDDGSRSETRAVLERLETCDPRLQIVMQENAGLPASRNRAIGLASGTWIAILDADDVWLPDKIERQIAVAAQQPGVGLIYTDFFNVDPVDLNAQQRVRCISYQPESPNILARYFVDDAPIIPSTVLIRKKAFTRAGGFDASFRIAEDNEMWIRMIAAAPIAHISEPLLLKRQRGNSLGSDAVRNMAFYDRITAKATQQFPTLAAKAGKRRARRLAKAGQYVAARGDHREALRYYCLALRHDPVFGKLYVLFCLLLLPGALPETCIKLLRRVRHG